MGHRRAYLKEKMMTMMVMMTKSMKRLLTSLSWDSFFL